MGGAQTVLDGLRVRARGPGLVVGAAVQEHRSVDLLDGNLGGWVDDRHIGTEGEAMRNGLRSGPESPRLTGQPARRAREVFEWNVTEF